MLKTMVIGGLGALLLSLVMKAMNYTRETEIDGDGNLIVRYLIMPYGIGLAGLLSLAVGVYQWFEPRNHQYPGNLTILSYTPIAISIFCFLYAIFIYKFRATLKNNEIIISRWPFPPVMYNLKECISAESTVQKYVLTFKNTSKFKIYNSISGRKNFIELVNKRI